MNTQLELWGGPECTVNRVGETYFDQLERTGHAHRLADLDLFADLGVRALRYPVLWERTAPNGLETADWTWPDERLERLRELDITPIVGLTHHGSGPRSTSLLDPQFPEKLAEYAGAVARRYPWVSRYTPVNEPLTTARFSGLYGHWYPHACDGLSWARMLLNQCRAVALSMAAIREVNPDARLVQTEDLGKTRSTPAMAYQADFENERRWLTFDLLCGRVDFHHPMAHFLRWLGIHDGELQIFRDNPCPPDIFGINYYVTSERFLDERVDLYPPWTVGTNAQGRYADVEAIRVCADGICGPAKLLREVWDRYHSPLAVTEAHLGASVDEQMRWLGEMWGAAQTLRREGVDVRAVTAWSLLGAYDWDSLVTRRDGHYEPGAFDVRDGTPQPTALAAMLRDLSRRGRHTHPHLRTPGWWRRSERLLYPPVFSGESAWEQPREPAAV
jgi:dTDP-4-dehydrorhamnose reductase